VTDIPWITVLTLTPLAGGFVLLGIERDQKTSARWLALLFSGLALAQA